MREERMGGLTARITGGVDREGGGDGPVVVLLHGFGAPGDDLVPLWRVLDVPREVRFVFPAAPLEMAMGMGESRAWWMLDPGIFEDMERQPRARRDRSGEVPEGLAEARASMTALLDDVTRVLAPRSPGAIVLGGFSQGAMLALDVALHTDRALAGLVLMSGTLIAKNAWQPRMKGRAGLGVLQSHGTEDPLLGFAQAEALRDLLVAGGLVVDFVSFRGGHQIPDRVLDKAGAFIANAFK